MNQLSIILYFADVAINVMNTIFGIGLFFVIGFLLINFVEILKVAVHNDSYDVRVDGNYLTYKMIWYKWLIIGFVMIVISNFIPTKQTMYMIAASEIGETVILSPEMSDTMGKVKTFVDLQLDGAIAELIDDKDNPVDENK